LVSGLVLVSVKNQTTSAWVQVGQVPLSNTDTSFTIPDLSASAYISASGIVEVKVDSVPNTRVTANNYKTYLDMVKVHVHN
jgi:hypothetical protein